MDFVSENEEKQAVSEEENDINLINVKSKKKKIIDSDSELDEPTTKELYVESTEPPAAESKENSNKLQNFSSEPMDLESETDSGKCDRLISTSNSKNEGRVSNDSEEITKIKFKKKPKRLAILDSDSEDESNPKDTDDTQSTHELENSSGKPTSGTTDENVTTSLDNEDEDYADDDDLKENGGNNTQVKLKKKTKCLAILDSDSEDESNSKNNQSPNELENSASEENVTVSTDNKDEDCEDDDLKENSDNKTREKLKKKLKRIAIVDSDSEDEVPVTPHNKSFNDDSDVPQTNNPAAVYITNEKGKLVAENDPEEPQGNVVKKSRFAALCDSESSEDENGYQSTHVERSKSLQNNKKRPTASKKSAAKASTEEPSGKKMTGKQALQQRQEIRSESQRMLRESRVSLPYHKPKAHSIKEFLQNRPRLSLSLLRNDNTPPSVAMKMSVQQLEIVTKKLEEREKVVQEFYKSESESDEENVQSEDAKIGNEENVQSEDAKMDNNKNDGESCKKTIENSEPGTNGQDKINVEICLESKEEDKSEEIVQDLDRQNGSSEEANVETSPMDIDVNISGSKSDVEETYLEIRVEETDVEIRVEETDVEIRVEENHEIATDIEVNISEVNSVNVRENELETRVEENQEIAANIGVTVEKTNDSLSTNIVDHDTILNRNEDQEEPEPDNNEFETNKTDNCDNNAVIPEEQDEAKISEEISLDGTKTPSINIIQNPDIQENNKEPNTHVEHSMDSLEFDFNLDDFDEDMTEDFPEAAKENCEISEITENTSEPKEKNIQEEHLQRLLKKYEAIDNPDDECARSAPTTEIKLNKQDLLKKLSATKPSLSGGPDNVIDLDEGVAKPSEVAQLMERFMKHALKKNVVKNKVQLDIINLTQGEVIKETVAMSVEPDEEPVAIMETPGIKLKKLRDELQSQIAQRRSELWQQKHHPLGEGLSKEKCDDEKSDCGADEDILDNEEEAELTDIDEEEEDDEYEDEDEYSSKPEKPRVKSAFVDEEAEEDDDENECDEASQNDEDHANEQCEEKEDSEQEDSNECQTTAAKKPLRRILKGFTEDSDEEENSQSVLDPQVVEKRDTRNKDSSFNSSNSTDTWEDDNIPPNQPRTESTPHKKMTQSKSAVLGLLTPVQHLTGLQGFNSGSKFLHESPVSPFILPPDPSPLKEKNWNTDLQKKLFSDSSDALDSETNMEDIAQLCSGKFPSLTLETARATSACSISTGESLATQEVISMCSGSFPEIASALKDHQEKNCEDLNENEGINRETDIVINKGGPVMRVNLNSNNEVKSLDDDRLILQLLDEEEMEQFKKKFESPLAVALSNVEVNESEMEVAGGGRLVSDCSDEDGDEDEALKNRKSAKKLQKRLAFSDDSDSEFEEDGHKDNNEEEINLHEDVSDDDFNDDAALASNKIIDYDSEENEIERDDQEAVPKQKWKPSDFVENEAELTESDWDSADEDEKDLDALEVEQGDADVFDENKIRNDLEKIHMRRVLDQDNREIKILQELLLEDGELHGTGRQRQFKWRNIDDAGNEEDGQRDAEIEAYLDEEESEEQWRRARHQREMFLKNKQEKHAALESDDFISTDSNSQVLKFGQEAVRKSLSAVPMTTEQPKPAPSSPEVKKPMMLLNTRGSFLARTDKFLSKLAEFTKASTTATVGASKNTKKIVFQTVSQSTKETAINNNKRKSENGDGSPAIIKKLRLSSNLTPVGKNVNRKKQSFK